MKELNKVDLDEWEDILLKYLRVVTASEFVLDCWRFKPSTSTHPTTFNPLQEHNRAFKIQLVTGPSQFVDLFEVKKSKIEGAGYGLFALREYNKNDIIGIYFGDIAKEGEACTDYSMKVPWRFKRRKEKIVIIDAFKSSLAQMKFEQRKPVYFGLHFVNDPYLCPEKTNATPNIQISDRLQGVATRDIKCGDEILLDYLYEDDPEVVEK